MTRLFDKYAPLKARVDMMMKMGTDALGVEFDDILSTPLVRPRVGGGGTSKGHQREFVLTLNHFTTQVNIFAAGRRPGSNHRDEDEGRVPLQMV